MSNKVYLGLDYGTKRIGLAIAFGPLAEPLEVISPTDVDSRISTLCRKYNITDLVVGVSEGDMAKLSQQFGQQIGKLTGLPVHYQNETLSSFEVVENLRSSQAKKSKRSGHIDQYAATLILQEYLDGASAL